ncbi:helix-turn-helix domain-containing protein [Arcticibacterium luteifluviistationis]|uniref:AraC family transcriptional regulator n=1 Tax=Arcticibacterium luteifluviistationis TaxID=1784714 RepID=A0A2Z4G6J1_9BACT|nr:AraC family transcriptional regulator [Arcticibacterium luteifluviistationis]AWV96778.1 AraC family transcriptional regulator [Arcticibacterium luteifluviistationis]
MKLYIQNMVCLCCKMTVAAELKKMGLAYSGLELGEVHLTNPITKKEKTLLKRTLHDYGLELMEDKKAILVEKIVALIISMIHDSEELPTMNFSVFLTNQLNQDYHTLSTLFSQTKGVTIEHFIILHKIERVKELIMYDELSLTEISYKLDYSSVAHLSNQFKKVTGLTPTFFKNIKNKKRIPLESL